MQDACPTPRRAYRMCVALTDEDLKAVLAYLKSLKPMQNQVPEPLPPK
jgi:hypothetical protein